MEIKELQENVDQWIKTIGVRYFSELTNMAILTEEVGELARLMSRKFGDQSFKQQMTEEQINQKLADELADIIWVVTCIANQTEVNLEKAIIENIKKKTNRDILRHKNNPKLM